MPMPQPGQVVNGYQYAGGDPNQQSSWKMLTGGDFLKTLQPTDASMVQAMTQGRMQPPAGFQLSKPYWQEKLQQAAQYEPGFDFTKWGRRAATAKDFGSGKSAQNLTSLNQVMHHMDTLHDAMIALHNHDFTPENAVGNYFEPMVGDPRVTNFNVARDAVANELTRVFRGTGGNESDIQEWRNNFSPNASPAQMNGAIKQAMGLINGRIDALGNQYQRGMDKQTDMTQFMSPESKAIYQRFSKFGTSQPPQGALNMLRQNPDMADQFDQKYGVGSAQQALSQ